MGDWNWIRTALFDEERERRNERERGNKWGSQQRGEQTASTPILSYSKDYRIGFEVATRLKADQGCVLIPPFLLPSFARFSSNPDRIRLRGSLRNFNTIEEFKQCDKAKLAQEVGEQVRYLSRSFLTRISDLNSCLF